MDRMNDCFKKNAKKYKVVFFDFFVTGESSDDDRKSSRYAHFYGEKSI